MFWRRGLRVILEQMRLGVKKPPSPTRSPSLIPYKPLNIPSSCKSYWEKTAILIVDLREQIVVLMGTQVGEFLAKSHS